MTKQARELIEAVVKGGSPQQLLEGKSVWDVADDCAKAVLKKAGEQPRGRHDSWRSLPQKTIDAVVKQFMEKVKKMSDEELKGTTGPQDFPDLVLDALSELGFQPE